VIETDDGAASARTGDGDAPGGSDGGAGVRPNEPAARDRPGVRSVRTDRDELTRRGLFRTTLAAGAAASLGAAGAGSAAAQSGPDYGGWFDDVGNYDGTTVDRTGQDAVTVEVGVDANGGTYGFGPAAVRVDPGTTVTFEWVSDTHNVLVEDQPGDSWDGSQSIENTGFTYEHTFETEGIYKYYCEPHLSLGMKGAIVVGGSGGGSGGGGAESGSGGQEATPIPAEYGGWFTDQASGGAVGNYDGTTEDLRGEDAVTIEVGTDANGGTYGFGPAAVRVSPGTTLTFEWVSDTHNVLLEEQPDGAGWEGHQPIENTGFTYEHTFETEGIYKYYCEPHLSLGMKGAIIVDPAAPGGEAGGEGGEGGEGEEVPPGAARILNIAEGVVGAVFVGLLFVIGYTVVKLDNMEEPGAEPVERIVTETAPVATPQREIEHDDYDPIGTFSLILVYFAIIAGMWAFMYFVEFLNNGPTVVG